MPDESYPCWCGSERAGVFWSGAYTRTNRIEHSEILRCNSCGTLRSGKQEGVYAAHGDGPGGKFVNLAPNEWEHLNANIVYSRCSPGPLLEVGANTGMMLNLLAGKGMSDLTGLEPNPACAAEARKGNHDVRDGWFTPEQTPPGPFETIVMSHVLEHIADPLGALQLAANRLADRGKLMLFVPNAASWRARANFARWGPLNPVDHIWHWEPKTIRKLIEASERFNISKIFSTKLRKSKLNSPRRIYRAIAEKFAKFFGKSEQLIAIVQKK